MAKQKFNKETYLQWFEQMMLVRRFEEKCAQLYGQQKIKGFLHLYIGQEAVVAGAMSAIKKDDKIITAYRDHGHALACGMSPNEIMAELFGKVTGCSKGNGGSMHLFSKEHNFYGGHGIVGGQIALGAGMAFAEQYLETKNISLTFMGDGAVRQGALNETFNMAMLWKLPVVFICENNGYAMGTSVQRSTNMTDLYKIGQGFDMPCSAVDGMSCEAVHDAIAEAAERARKGNGPTFLEIRTYRYRGHSMSDPAKYRSKDEVEDYKTKKDPIEMVRKTILSNKWATEKALEKTEDAIMKLVSESVEFAEESPYPPAENLYNYVYQQEDYPFIIE